MGKYFTSGQKKGKNGGPSIAHAGRMAGLQTAAQELLESVLAMVLQILGTNQLNDLWIS